MQRKRSRARRSLRKFEGLEARQLLHADLSLLTTEVNKDYFELRTGERIPNWFDENDTLLTKAVTKTAQAGNWSDTATWGGFAPGRWGHCAHRP